jgi:hypothetical protein
MDGKNLAATITTTRQKITIKTQAGYSVADLTITASINTPRKMKE